jgi:hypothetical protein
MTTDPTRSDPPFGADTDEAVSARLDGELAAFAADHGTTEADARARLEAWSGFDDRRAELAAARATVATPVPPLDEITRRRLVRNASDARSVAAAGRRGARAWKIVGAAAAALVVVVGIGLAINAAGDNDGGSSDSASSSAGSVATDLRGNLGDVGDLSGPEALRALLAGTRDVKTAPERVDATKGAGNATSAQSGSVPAPQQFTDSAGPSLPPDQCAAQLAGKRPVTFVGTGTYQGRAVTVVGLTERVRVIAFLVPSNDCTNVLTSVSR